MGSEEARKKIKMSHFDPVEHGLDEDFRLTSFTQVSEDLSLISLFTLYPLLQLKG